MSNCKYPHCDKPKKSRGFCDKHYRRFSKLETNIEKAKARPPVGTHGFHAVYVIGCFHFAPIKIGRTQNIWRRMSDLQIGCPYRLFVFGARFGTPEVIMGLEWEVHKTLTELDCNRRGEWFDIDPNDALAVIDKCADMHDHPVLDMVRYRQLRASNMDVGELHKIPGAPSHTDIEMIIGSMESSQKLLTQGANLDNTYL